MRKRLAATALAVAMITGGPTWVSAAATVSPSELQAAQELPVSDGGATRREAGMATTDLGNILVSGTTMDARTQHLSSTSGQFEIRADPPIFTVSWRCYSCLPVGDLPLARDPDNLGHDVLAMQSDGNLVLYTDGKAAWASDTDGNPGARAVLQDDGNFVVYPPTGWALWSSGTFATSMISYRDAGVGGATYLAPQWFLANNGYTLAMQPDGNLVLYSPTRAVWASNTDGNPGAQAVLQGDGNLVVYSATGKALWANGQNPGHTFNILTTLTLQPDGNLVQYLWDFKVAPERIVWTTGTDGRP